MGLLIFFLFIAAIVYLVWTAYQNMNSLMPEVPLGHWNHHFPDLEFSALEFYEAIAKTVQERKIPKATTLKGEFSEHGELLDRHRTYLRIRNRN